MKPQAVASRGDTTVLRGDASVSRGGTSVQGRHHSYLLDSADPEKESVSGFDRTTMGR
jgi:hypothetical protein